MSPLPPSAPSVLICDDESMLVSALCRAFRRAGVDPIPLTSADQLQEAARRLKPSVILLDIHQREFDGRDLLLRLKEDPLTNDIPVVMVTGSVDEFAKDCCLKRGAVDFVLKPFPDGFVRKVVRLSGGESESFIAASAFS